jgi:pilus assembly protein Flp/PilA
MVQFARVAWDFLREEDGPTAVEYAVMLALIVVGCITAILSIGNNVDETAEVVTSALQSAS